MARKVRTAQQMERTRADLLDASAEALARHGVHTATMEQIARACDCTVPTLYAYFETKQAIVHAVLATVVRESAELLASPRPGGLSLRQHLELLLMDMFRWSDHRTFYLQVAGTPLLGGKTQPGSASDRMPAALADVLRQHPDEIPKEDVHEVSHALWGLVHGYGLMRIDDAKSFWTPEHTAATIVRRLAASWELSDN